MEARRSEGLVEVPRDPVRWRRRVWFIRLSLGVFVPFVFAMMPLGTTVQAWQFLAAALIGLTLTAPFIILAELLAPNIRIRYGNSVVQFGGGFKPREIKLEDLAAAGLVGRGRSQRVYVTGRDGRTHALPARWFESAGLGHFLGWWKKIEGNREHTGRVPAPALPAE